MPQVSPKPTRAQRMYGMGYSLKEIERMTRQPMEAILRQLKPYLKPQQVAQAKADHSKSGKAAYEPTEREILLSRIELAKSANNAPAVAALEQQLRELSE